MASRETRRKIYRLAVVYFEDEDNVAKVETKRIKEDEYSIGSKVTVDEWSAIIKFLHSKFSTGFLRLWQNPPPPPTLHSFPNGPHIQLQKALQKASGN